MFVLKSVRRKFKMAKNYNASDNNSGTNKNSYSSFGSEQNRDLSSRNATSDKNASGKNASRNASRNASTQNKNMANPSKSAYDETQDY